MLENNNNNNNDMLINNNNLSIIKNIYDIEGRCTKLKSVEKDVLFRYLDIIKLDNIENISQIIQKYSKTFQVDQDCGIYELIQETYASTSDKRPYDKKIDGYILMAYKTMEDMYSEEFAYNWKLWSGIRHLCAKIPAPYHFEGIHFYKELTNICQFKYLLIIDVKKLLFYVATTLNVLQTVKPKLCAYVGVYKEIYNENNKNDGTSNNNNLFTIKNNNKNKGINSKKNENEVRQKIRINNIKKNLTDKNWCYMLNIENKEKNRINFEFNNKMVNISKMNEHINIPILNSPSILNNKSSIPSEGNQIKEGNKKLNIQSSLPFSFLYRERLNFLYIDNNIDNISHNYYRKNDLNNINLAKTNYTTNCLYDLENLRKELLMDKKYLSPIYTRNEWLTYPNHEASIKDFQFSKLINLLK
uniref:CRAL-TRIO domain-containing protein n=1 Tax=Strongyloides stercoralis TaxID=6248 RepID=A0A0K0EP25_STRER